MKQSRVLYPGDWHALPKWARALTCLVFGHIRSPFSNHCKRECGHTYEQRK